MSEMKRSMRITAARTVLDDCRTAFEKLERCDPDSGEWRVYWVAAVTLLRAVGHVLDKVDGESDPVVAQAVANWWTKLKADRPAYPLFWEFIDNERNNILKEYKVGVDFYEGFLIAGGEAVFGGEFMTVQDGIYSGEDGRDLIHEALKWWSEQLDQIEAAM